jgi:hypothetical protein
MNERKSRYIYYFAGCLIAYLCLGCATGGETAGPLVSDIGNGTVEYRAIQEDIRSGETDLAVTGAGIERASGQPGPVLCFAYRYIYKPIFVYLYNILNLHPVNLAVSHASFAISV